MRALFLPGGRQVEIREVAEPEAGPGEVVIALGAAGLCGSDLHMHYRPEPERRHGMVFGLTTDPGIVPGHEPAGSVAEVGPGVENLHLGDRVAVHHMGGCGTCMACRRGRDIDCQRKWGTYGLDKPGAMRDPWSLGRATACSSPTASASPRPPTTPAARAPDIWRSSARSSVWVTPWP